MPHRRFFGLSSLLLLFSTLPFFTACGRTPLLEPVDGSAVDSAVGDAGAVDAPPDRDSSTPCGADFECDDGIFCNGPERCFGGRCQPGAPVACEDGLDCTDNFCDEVTRSCIATIQDRDRDGYQDARCGGADCDDDDPNVNPGWGERCDNGRDDDCNGFADCDDFACGGFPGCLCDPEPERCANGVDDDCDFRVDCDDVDDCGGSPACTCIALPEICTNGVDDDCDLLVDCADGDCDSDPACCVPTPEICTNGVDDDCNMLADCADPSCAGDPACAPPCPDRDLASRVGNSVAVGTTVGQRNDLTATCAGMARSEDVAFSWTAPTTGTYVFDTIGSEYDTALHIHARSCGGPQLACDDDGGPGTISRITLDVTRGQFLVIVVDGFAGGSAGNYVLNINTLQPEAGRCADGLDNDRDGQTDCADPDCRLDPACAAPCPDVDLGSMVGLPVTSGSTGGTRDDLRGSCAFNRASDIAFSWTAPRTARYIFDTNGSGYDTLLYLLDGSCSAPELACNDNSGSGSASRIVRNVTGGTRLVIVVDGSGFSAGSYNLNIRAREGAFCSDGVDNDLDGRTDCDDTECAGRPICCVPAPEMCTNGTDDDCDTLVDCADPNCNSSPACCMPTAEDCANAADEDCDGLIDCVDPDCRLDPRC